MYTLVNSGGTSINWTATKTQDWLSLSETSGTLENDENIGIAVSINTDAKNLEPGMYSDTVSFANTTNGNGNATRSVHLSVHADISLASVKAMPAILYLLLFDDQ